MLRVHGQLARTNIAELIGYSPSKITGIVNELMEAGIVEERDDSTYTGGRRAKDIFFNPNFGYIVAAVIGVDTLDVALIDFAEKTRVRRLLPIRNQDGPSAILHSLTSFITERLNKFDLPIEKVYGVGITLPGAIHPHSGTPYASAEMPGWNGFQIDSLLREVFPYAVIIIERDTNAMAFGELRKGAARQLKHFVYINVGQSINAGIIIDGKIYHGANGQTGEIFRLQNADADAHSSSKRAHNENEHRAVQIGKAISTLVNILDPQMVLIGGNASLGHSFLAEIRRSILDFSQSSSTQHLQVDLAPLSIEASLIGIMALTAEHIFTVSD